MLGRRHWLELAGTGSLAALLGACKGLDSLDVSAGAEGTGMQFSAIVKVLARYQANPTQKQVAERRAGTAYVKIALEPAYKKRRAVLVAKAKAQPEDASKVVAVAALDQAWYKEAAAASHDAYKPDIVLPGTGNVAFASVQEESAVLLASAASYVPKMIAVAVPPAGNPAEASAAGSVMFWSTGSRGLATPEVFVVASLPPVGKSARFDQIDALYRGEGG